MSEDPVEVQKLYKTIEIKYMFYGHNRVSEMLPPPNPETTAHERMWTSEESLATAVT